MECLARRDQEYMKSHSAESLTMMRHQTRHRFMMHQASTMSACCTQERSGTAKSLRRIDQLDHASAGVCGLHRSKYADKGVTEHMLQSRRAVFRLGLEPAAKAVELNAMSSTNRYGGRR